MLTAYSGEITKYQGERKSLQLKWLHDEDALETYSFKHQGTELLYNLADMDVINDDEQKIFLDIKERLSSGFTNTFHNNLS